MDRRHDHIGEELPDGLFGLSLALSIVFPAQSKSLGCQNRIGRDHQMHMRKVGIMMHLAPSQLVRSPSLHIEHGNPVQPQIQLALAQMWLGLDGDNLMKESIAILAIGQLFVILMELLFDQPFILTGMVEIMGEGRAIPAIPANIGNQLPKGWCLSRHGFDDHD
jgi:hypothetical protein